MKGYLLNAMKRCIGILFPNFLQEPAHSVGSDIGMCHLCFKQRWGGQALNLTVVKVWQDSVEWVGEGLFDIIFSAKKNLVYSTNSGIRI